MTIGRAVAMCTCTASALLCAFGLHGCGPAPTPSPAPVPMPTLKLRNGVEMPIMSAGVWQYTVAEAEKSVAASLSAGFTHIDTAYDYKNQEGVAKAITAAITGGKKREDIFITTKVPGCGIQNSSAISTDACTKDTATRIADDLQQLGVKYIDLLLIHFPPCPGQDGSPKSPMESKCYEPKTGCDDPKSCDMIKAQWSAVSQAYDKKQLKAVGVSNYCKACLACLDGQKLSPMVNQVHFQVGMGPDPQGFRTLAEKKGIVLQAWSPLGMGGNGSKPIMHGNLTTELSKKYGKSAVQIALKWIVSRNVSVSTKSSNPVHIAQNLDIFDFELNADDMKALDEANFAAKDEPSFLCRDPQPHEPVIVEAII